MTSRWEDIGGFEGRYQVSDHGEVRNANTGRVLKPIAFRNGYLRVYLGRGKAHLVHRLVAAAFVPGDNALQVNHKDGQRGHNVWTNLEWLSCGDNHRHSYRELNRKEHALKRPVRVGGVVYESGKAAAEALGVNPGSVMSAIHRNHRVRGLEAAYV
jgi:hypothetical protein